MPEQWPSVTIYEMPGVYVDVSVFFLVRHPNLGFHFKAPKIGFQITTLLEQQRKSSYQLIFRRT